MTIGSDPVHPTVIDLNPTGHLTKRELFAAMAMQGLLVNEIEAMKHGYRKPEDHLAAEIVCRSAVFYADALIAELNKSHGQ